MATWGTSNELSLSFFKGRTSGKLLPSALGNSFPEHLPLPRDHSLTVPLKAMEYCALQHVPLKILQELFSAMQVFFSFCKGNPLPKTERPFSF